MADEFFSWFQTSHDFAVPSSQKVEKKLRKRILNLGVTKTVEV